MADYDIYFDAGVPQSEGPDNVAPVVLVLGNGEKIDSKGPFSLTSSSRRFGEGTSGG